MTNFWENIYRLNTKMWGEKPTDNALKTVKLLQNKHIKNVLIPGFGYGRNAKIFYTNGFDITGIEISETAIKRAKNYFGNTVTIHHGSVTEMPFDNKLYQSIYCYSLIHLLNDFDRKNLIKNCYSQLAQKGIMIFVALSTNDKRYGIGNRIARNTFQSPHGLSLYFYDENSIKDEFGEYNIIMMTEIDEPQKNPTEKHWMVICEK